MANRDRNYRTPIKQAKGLGSAHYGVEHWWIQRLTAAALVPLYLWFIFGVAVNSGGGYEEAVAWIGSPLNAVLMILTIVATFYHGALGNQVILEDYVGNQATRLVLNVVQKFAALVLATAAVLAVLKIALGG